MATTTDKYETLERKVGRRVRDDASHRRLAEALTEVAVAAIHPADCLGGSRPLSLGMLEYPIESATHAAVETLVTRLEDLVETLSSATIDQLTNEQMVADHGLE